MLVEGSILLVLSTGRVPFNRVMPRHLYALLHYNLEKSGIVI